MEHISFFKILKGFISRSKMAFVWASLGLLVCGILIVSIFCWGRDFKPFNSAYVADHNVFSSFGAFVGGITGAFVGLLTLLIAIFTVYFQHEVSVKNNEFQKMLNDNTADLQKKLAEDSSKQMEMDRFNALYAELINLYYSQREWLKNSIPNNESLYPLSDNGKQVRRISFFDYYSNQLQSRVKIKNNYGQCLNVAKAEYELFFLNNSNLLAPYFRTIYRLFDLIDNSKIEDEEKYKYGKITRAIFSESEILFMRYNAMTSYGLKMRRYMNKYHLLKHLPFFKIWEVNNYLFPRQMSDSSNNTLPLNIILKDLSRHIHKFTHNRPDKDFFPFIVEQDNKYCLLLDMSSPYKTTIRLEYLPGTRYYPHMIYHSHLKVFHKRTEDWIAKLFSTFLREIYAYGCFNEYQSYREVNITTSILNTKQIDTSIQGKRHVEATISMRLKPPYLRELRL